MMKKHILMCVISILIVTMLCTGCSILGAKAEVFAEETFIAALEQAAAQKQASLSFAYAASDALEAELDSALTKAYDRYIIGENIANISWTAQPFLRSTEIRLDLEYKEKYSDERSSAIRYSEEAFAAAVIEKISAREETLRMLFLNDGTITDTGLKAEMDRILFGGEYAAMTYYLSRAQYSVTTYDEYLVLGLEFDYAENTVGAFADLPQPESTEQAIEEILKQWNDSNIALLYLSETPADAEAYCHTVVTTAIANDADFTYNCETYYWNAYGTRDCIITLDRRYDYDQSELDRMSAEVTEAARQIAAEVTETDPAAAVKEIAGILCDRVTYDDPLASSILSEHELSHESNIRRTAYGALINGASVCTGYAKAFQLICDLKGIDCWTVDGTVEDVGHEWNAVFIDGEMLYVDVTFADTGKNKDFYLFGEDLYQEKGYTADAGFYIPAA